MANNQLACTYAALLLADSGKTDAASILAVTKAAGLEVSSGFANVYASILKDVNLNDVLSNLSFGGAVGGGSAAAGASAGAAAAGGAAPAAAAAAEPEEEEDDDMGFGLFD